MIAYKGFNKELACTLGKGVFRYQVGQTYKEELAECARTGFHCVEEPIEVLQWYREGRYCVVEALGDIHEDGNKKISCSEMRILREISKEQLGALECEWMRTHPERAYSNEVCRNTGEARQDGIIVVRGKNPKAAGGLGATIFLVKEQSGEIVAAGAYRIDGTEYLPGIYYNVEGRKVRCGKKN